MDCIGDLTKKAVHTGLLFLIDKSIDVCIDLDLLSATKWLNELEMKIKLSTEHHRLFLRPSQINSEHLQLRLGLSR